MHGAIRTNVTSVYTLELDVQYKINCDLFRWIYQILWRMKAGISYLTRRLQTGRFNPTQQNIKTIFTLIETRRSVLTSIIITKVLSMDLKGIIYIRIKQSLMKSLL